MVLQFIYFFVIFGQWLNAVSIDSLGLKLQLLYKHSICYNGSASTNDEEKDLLFYAEDYYMAMSHFVSHLLQTDSINSFIILKQWDLRLQTDIEKE